MTHQERIEAILLVGKFMNKKNLFPYWRAPAGGGEVNFTGVYVADNADGDTDFADGIIWYSPDSDWNTLMDAIRHWDTCLQHAILAGKKAEYIALSNELDMAVTSNYIIDDAFPQLVENIKWYYEQVEPNQPQWPA